MTCALPPNRYPEGKGVRTNDLSAFSSTFMVGSVVVTRVEERIYNFPIQDFIPDATPERLAANLDWLAPYGVKDLATMTMPVNGYVLESRGQRILVDTCVGEEHSESEPESLFVKRMQACGYDPETIDVVICTHFHYDHVGWNTMMVGDERVPTFTNARYLFAQDEWDGAQEWSEEITFEAVLHESFKRHVSFIVTNGRADLVSGEIAITPDVSILPTPGHTPGHQSVAIKSEGAAAVITGDAIHHPFQLAEPSVSTTADHDPGTTVATRERLIDWVVDHDALIIGSHFSGPGMGHISHANNRTTFSLTRNEGTS